MTFYAELSKYYDEVFPTDAAEMRFVAQLLQGRNHVLDVGCGNGNKTVLLKAPDRQIWGVDSDEAMIAAARERYAAAGVDYAVMDMLELAENLAGRAFDGVICLGNTLVHLHDKDAVEAFIDSAYGLLAPGGVCVIQILHYEWIIAGNVTELPFTETPNVVFRRNYVWCNGKLHFCTALLDKHSGAEYKNDITLLPLLTTELAAMLTKRGFVNLRHYGGYDGRALKPNSLVSIVACQK